LEKITSTKNDIVKKTIEIKNDCQNLVFLENIKLIEEAHRTGHKIEYVLVQEDKVEYYQSNFSFVFGNQVFVVSKNILDKVCDTKSPQGIVAVAQFERQTPTKIDGNFLVIESLQDPGNLGTIIRSASGTSFKNIYLIDCVSFLNQKTIRSSMGGIFRENLFSFSSLEEFLNFYKPQKATLLVATMEGENVFELKNLSSPLGVVIGNEGKGVSDKMKTLATKLVAIPMKNGLESLNAGVSCSVIIYALDNLMKKD
jgi:TrmH family RNA methyltransferase